MNANAKDKQPQPEAGPDFDQKEPSWLTDHKRDQAAMRWFWRGALIALPTAFIFGIGDFTAAVVLQVAYSILLFIALATFIYRGWKGIKLGQRSSENESMQTHISHLVMLTAGFGISFATLHFIGQLLHLAANRH